MAVSSCHHLYCLHEKLACLATPSHPIFSYQMTTKKNPVATIVKNWRVRSHKHGGIIMALVRHPILNDMNTLHVVVVSNSHARLSGEIVMVWLLPVLPIKSRPPSRNKISDSYNSRGLKTCTSPFSLLFKLFIFSLHNIPALAQAWTSLVKLVLFTFHTTDYATVRLRIFCSRNLKSRLDFDSIEMSLERCSLEKVKC